MTIQFQKKEQNQLTKWIGGRKKCTLLYKASRDGCTSTAFHNTCNNKGPTVTILYNADNFMYGGYTAVNWKSIGNYQTDGSAFLFRLYQNGTWKPVRMTVMNTQHAMYDNASYGPTFGAHDILTFTNTVNFDGTNFSLNGSTNFGVSYTMNGENYNSIANSHLRVKEIEVYLVEDLAAGTPLDDPWRKTAKWNPKIPGLKFCTPDTRFVYIRLISDARVKNVKKAKYSRKFKSIKDPKCLKVLPNTAKLLNELKEKVEKYKPLKDLKVPQARILLVGQVGAGKSSFFNTINSIFRGYITSQACSGNAEHSLTTMYRMYQIRNGQSGTPMNFRLHDTRGLEADQGIDSHEMNYLLDGNLPDRHQFNPSVPISGDTAGFVVSPNLSDKIHCVIFVLDGSIVDVIPEKVIERMKNLQLRMNQRGIPQVVLLTKIDKVCEATAEDISQVFYSPVIQETVDRVSQIMGLPRSHILPIKNYESEMELNENVNILALLTLQQVLHFADDYMYNYLDQLEEGKFRQLHIRE